MENKISLSLINPLAIEICKTLQYHGHQAFIVGGCVRDLLLNKKPKDWDITTSASPKQVISIFDNTIPTGLQHGTVTVCMAKGLESHFEVTTFRIEGEYLDGRRPEEVKFVSNIEEDLARRDLTINAMAFDPILEKLVDPFNGFQDLQNGLIKAVGNPNLRFQEDGLRIMRAARFVARFGYTIDPNTFNGMKINLETLKKVSKERIKDELCKILLSDFPSEGLQLLFDSKVLDIVCPLLAGRQLPLLSKQNKCPGDLETKIAFLYNKLPLEQVQNELTNLKFSNNEIKKTIFLIDLLRRFYEFQMDPQASSFKALWAHIKNQTPDTWEHSLNEFIRLSSALEIPIYESLIPFQNEIVLSRKEMVLNGNDLLEIGMKAGPKIKQALDLCYNHILQYPEHNTKTYLISFVKLQLVV